MAFPPTIPPPPPIRRRRPSQFIEAKGTVRNVSLSSDIITIFTDEGKIHRIKYRDVKISKMKILSGKEGRISRILQMTTTLVIGVIALIVLLSIISHTAGFIGAIIPIFTLAVLLALASNMLQLARSPRNTLIIVDEHGIPHYFIIPDNVLPQVELTLRKVLT